MPPKNMALLSAFLLMLFLQATPVVSDDPDDEAVARGKYLVEIGGCNDCHAVGFAPSGGAIPEFQWLLGDTLGYRGPWGTTYPANLRAYVAKLTEDQRVSVAKVLRTRPPIKTR